MFSNAKKVTAVPIAARAKSSKSDAEYIDGLDEVAALDACAKAIAGLLSLKKDDLKTTASDLLFARGLDNHSAPDTLRLASGDDVTGRVSIRKRSTASPLSQDELAMLADAVGDSERDEDGNITAVPGFAETLETMPAMLAVNPAYARDEALLKRIDAALKSVKGIPEDFILNIPASAKVVVSDAATDAVFRLAPEAAAVVFPIVAGLSISTVYKNIERAWAIVRPLLVPDVTEAKASVKRMLRASVKAAS